MQKILINNMVEFQRLFNKLRMCLPDTDEETILIELKNIAGKTTLNIYQCLQGLIELAMEGKEMPWASEEPKKSQQI